ncbi:hypothetical protein EDB92DRAFT_2118045 [Lactarius akahatsu]|uniref:SMODS and SLOG-associating 2TM effector domain-containing protein n=1 Tax=Lactarius akahatsu TaxID=416441 RepID=A0AAD4L7T1_9AGAM|nr:hypothetical protein EDB92DRAFT_2118045 [Lactarius akahatsu]
MSTPEPNASTPPTLHIHPVSSVPTTPLSAIQTMMSSLPLPVASQGAPSLPAPHLKVSPGAHMPASMPAPAPATQIAANHTTYAPASVSSYGGLAPAPPPARYSSPTLPERLHRPPPPRSEPDLPPDVGCFGRLISHFTGNETVGHNRDDSVHVPVGSFVTTYAPSWLADHSATGASSLDQYDEGTIGARLQPTVDIAEAVSKKAARKAYQTEWFLNCAIGLQVLIGALTTALGAVLSGKNTSVAISVLGGAATFVASYLARMRSSSEPEASRLRAKNLNRFLREVQAFQLDHGREEDPTWDKQIDIFRSRLENILSKSGKVTNNPEAAGPYSGAHKEVAANRAPGSNNEDGMYSLSAKDPMLQV